MRALTAALCATTKINIELTTTDIHWATNYLANRTVFVGFKNWLEALGRCHISANVSKVYLRVFVSKKIFVNH